MSSLAKDRIAGVLETAPSPHLQSSLSRRTIILGMTGSLAPILLSSVIDFGWNALHILSLAVISGVVFEFVFAGLAQKKSKVQDGSTVLIASLFSFLLPASLPSWMVVFGAFLAVIVGKEIFGGFGQSLFHPALVGYLGLGALFPLELGTSSAIGVGNFVAVMIAGAVPLWKRWIRWQPPLFYVLTVGLGALLLGRNVDLLKPELFFFALFMVGDSRTIPIVPRGRTIFAIGAGMLTLAIQFWTFPLRAVACAILLMNAAVPLLDRFSRPSVK